MEQNRKVKADFPKGTGFMIAAASSGSGKTVISCALMSAFVQKGLQVAACKCGPDYIDPMFHREVVGVPSENLDLFFCGEAQLRDVYERHAEAADIVVTEGVMGYYDGMALDSEKASSYDTARTLGLPVFLTVSCKGMARSVVPMILGLLAFREDNQICGILLNRVSAALYPRMKEMIEEELKKAGHPLPVVGYVPENEVFCLKSRHLGLVTPEETKGIQDQLNRAGEILAETVELEKLLAIAEAERKRKPKRERQQEETQKEQTQKNQVQKDQARKGEPLKEQAQKEQTQKAQHIYIGNAVRQPRIAVARDEAFCFYYQANLNMFKELGCELVEFSPLCDSRLPENLQGLLLGGGYPEIYAKELSENSLMCEAVRRAVGSGIPCLAECGGFLYLHETLEGQDGKSYAMVNVIRGNAVRTGRLVRFGYVEIEAEQDGAFLRKGEKIRGHEFHYWDSTDNGSACLAVKPDGKRSWNCIHMNGNLFAGYPHLYFPSNPVLAERFVEACRNSSLENE